MTPPMIRTDIYAVVREADKGAFANKEHVIVAVTEGNPNYDAFLKTTNSRAGGRCIMRIPRNA